MSKEKNCQKKGIYQIWNGSFCFSPYSPVRNKQKNPSTKHKTEKWEVIKLSLSQRKTWPFIFSALTLKEIWKQTC